MDHHFATGRKIEQPVGAHSRQLPARRFDRQSQYVGDLLAAEGQFESVIAPHRTGDTPAWCCAWRTLGACRAFYASRAIK
jgi:hypothetical protein